MRTIILLFVCIVLAILLVPLLFFCIVFRLQSPIIQAAKGAMGLCAKIQGIKIEIKGKEWIDKDRNYVFMPNHLSFLDGPILFYAIPQAVRIILKKSIFRIPVIGLSMKQVEFVPVDRKGIKGGKKSILKAAHLMKTKHYSFLIFPEGTRSLDGKFQAFRRGGFFLALDSRAPIIPMTIQGTFALMPKGSFWIKPGRVSVEFFKPIPVNTYSAETMPDLMKKVRDVIQSGLDPDRQHT